MSGNGAIRILTVDDHKMFREGLAMVLATQPDMNHRMDAKRSGLVNGANQTGSSIITDNWNSGSSKTH